MFGTDLSARPDTAGTLIDGADNLVEALARRLQTPKGALFYDPAYGSGLHDWLGEGLTDDGAGAAVTVEIDLEDDPRVRSALVTVESITLRSLALRATVETAAGPFELLIDGAYAAGVISPQIDVRAAYGTG